MGPELLSRRTEYFVTEKAAGAEPVHDLYANFVGKSKILWWEIFLHNYILRAIQKFDRSPAACAQ